MKLSDKEIITVAREYKNQASWNRFHTCNAYISATMYNRWVLIKSYSTIVGVVDHREGEFYEIGKYSQTTSKQVTRIYNEHYSQYNRNFINGEV